MNGFHYIFRGYLFLLLLRYTVTDDAILALKTVLKYDNNVNGTHFLLALRNMKRWWGTEPRQNLPWRSTIAQKL